MIKMKSFYKHWLKSKLTLFGDFVIQKTYLADVFIIDNCKTFYASHGLVKMHSPKQVTLSANGIFLMRTVCTYSSTISIKSLAYKLSLNPHPNNMTLMRHFLSI